jgi:tripartite-type tricarboxylate transporter receptor subunit TctC
VARRARSAPKPPRAPSPTVTRCSLTVASIFVLNPVLYKKLGYDPDRDFRMLAIVTDVPVVMVVHPSIPAKTVAEFVAYARQNPGKLNFGSAGTGGTVHLSGEMFKQMAGIDMIHVPYKGLRIVYITPLSFTCIT